MNKLCITKPDDWHVHLRDGALLQAVIADSAQRFGRVLVMPNLHPPVRTVAQAGAYRDRIRAALRLVVQSTRQNTTSANAKTHFPAPHSPVISAMQNLEIAAQDFQPLMTLFLTESTTVQEIEKAHTCGWIHAIKYYPAGATTHSELGVRNLKACREIFSCMASLGLPLCVHAEVIDPAIDIYDREKIFLERELLPLLLAHPTLKLVVEHVSTREGVAFVRSAGSNVAATITAHHLLYNRNALLVGGLHPHFYCLPVLKREAHRQALIEAATSGSPQFFLGTDSAPHLQGDKESACGCAGCYTAYAGIELYAEIFEQAGKLAQLEGFASRHGANFYGLAQNKKKITLIKQPQKVPGKISLSAESAIVPLAAGETLNWSLATE